MNEEFIYEDHSSIEDGILRYNKKQTIKASVKKAKVFSRYARYFFLGALVLALTAILLAYAWQLLKKERIIIKTVQTSEVPSSSAAEEIEIIDSDGNKETVIMMSNLTHFKTISNKKIGKNSYDITTRWEYNNASNAKLGAYPSSQSCYAKYNKNSLEITLELVDFKNGKNSKRYNNSDLAGNNISQSEGSKMISYCQWKK